MCQNFSNFYQGIPKFMESFHKESSKFLLYFIKCFYNLHKIYLNFPQHIPNIFLLYLIIFFKKFLNIFSKLFWNFIASLYKFYLEFFNIFGFSKFIHNFSKNLKIFLGNSQNFCSNFSCFLKFPQILLKILWKSHQSFFEVPRNLIHNIDNFYFQF